MGGLIVDSTGLAVEGAGDLLCATAFLFLFQQSRMAFFGLWASAWAVRLVAVILGYELVRRQNWESFAAYAIAGLLFALVLITAGARSAIAGSAAGWKGWPHVLRLGCLVPLLIAPFYSGWPSRLNAYQAAQAVLLGLVYVYNFLMLRTNTGVGAHAFRIALLVLAAAPFWERNFDHGTYYQTAFQCVLAFGAMAMWGENQGYRIRDLVAELDHLRREIKHGIDLDRLTGLFNQAALSVRIETCQVFDGVVAVCDMDNFKEINDRYGHLVGDEILRHIGHLLQSSIRQEDEAFRWGGDEFVVLFHQQTPGVADSRMAEMEARLREFQVRGSGVLPISFSWGTADGRDRRLRESLDEADRVMYQSKRSRATGQRTALS
jgi:diguanylate cyclase (GGDEF)-like protein